MPRTNELKERYRRTQQRIGEAAERSGRRAEQIVCVAVTKTASPDQIRRLMELGHQDFGENRVQQLQQRVAMTEELLSRHRMMGTGGEGAPPERVRWHMVGHLQRNKVKTVIPLVKLIHSVDSLRLAEELEQQAAKEDREVDVLLQVNSSGEGSKHGFKAPAVPHVAEQMTTMTHLKVRGLMTMAPYSENPEESRPYFQRTAELFRDIATAGTCGRGFNILSMGMSNDFEVAVECGANLIRLGRALFGEPQAASA